MAFWDNIMACLHNLIILPASVIKDASVSIIHNDVLTQTYGGQTQDKIMAADYYLSCKRTAPGE